MEAIPIFLFWIVALWAVLQPRHVLVYVFFASMAFGSFAAVPTAITGGLTLTPTPIITLLLIAKELGSANGIRNTVADSLNSSRMLLMFLFWLVAGIVTLFMPRFFAGQVQVVPVRSAVLVDTAMLAPTAQNISQFVYISISVLAVFVFARILYPIEMRRHVLPAFCWGAAITILTGAIDYLSQYLPVGEVLEVFRTASYALLTNDEVLDNKRVVGLMPEASAFGSLSLSFLVALYFFRRSTNKVYLRSWVVPVLMLFLLICVWMSTSSAAYLGLGLFAVIVIAEWFWRFLTAHKNQYLRRSLLSEFYLGALLICGLAALAIFMPRALAPFQEMLDVMVFQKSTTSSFEERSTWTKVSWNALIDTYGLGVGMGGTRASNFAVALISNAGVISAIFYFSFLLQCLIIRRAHRKDMEGVALMAAVRWAYLPPFFASLTIGTTPDFGVFNAFLLGISVAVSKTSSLNQKRIPSVGKNSAPRYWRSFDAYRRKCSQ